MYEKELFQCFNKIDWASQIVETESAKSKAKKVVVIMVPGLTASFKEPYIR